MTTLGDNKYYTNIGLMMFDVFLPELVYEVLCRYISPSNPHRTNSALVVGLGLLHCTGMEKLEDLPPDLLRHAFAVADKDKQLELHSGAWQSRGVSGVVF